MSINNKILEKIKNDISYKNTKLLIVTKTRSQEDINQLIKMGYSDFAENRVQEAQEKFINIKETNPDIELHLTGPLQSNKVKTAINLFDVFHTLDREKIAKEFSKYPMLLKKKKFFVQINTGKEQTKSGIYPNDLKDFLFYLNYDLNLFVEGLMCIPPIDEDPKHHFNTLKILGNENNIKNLSIGMSSDYNKALEFNPTYIRLGTILFGKR